MAIKQVVAVFNVDTDDDDKRWTKQDIALHLDINFATPDNDPPDATVWDSVADFLADVRDGLVL